MDRNGEQQEAEARRPHVSDADGPQEFLQAGPREESEGRWVSKRRPGHRSSREDGRGTSLRGSQRSAHAGVRLLRHPGAWGPGFWNFSQVGFFGTGGNASGLPNVPVVRIELDDGTDQNLVGIRTWAQIDPGYADTDWPYTIEINDALFQKLTRLAPALTTVGTTVVDDCDGKATTVPVYVAPGKQLRIEDANGGEMFRVKGYHFVRKPKGTGSCGGIGGMDKPAAQLGASFLPPLRHDDLQPSQAGTMVEVRLLQPACAGVLPNSSDLPTTALIPRGYFRSDLVVSGTVRACRGQEKVSEDSSRPCSGGEVLYRIL